MQELGGYNLWKPMNNYTKLRKKCQSKFKQKEEKKCEEKRDIETTNRSPIFMFQTERC